MFGQKKQKSGSTKEKLDKEPQKPSWFEINRSKFEEVKTTFTIIKIIKILKLTQMGGIMIWKKQKQFGNK